MSFTASYYSENIIKRQALYSCLFKNHWVRTPLLWARSGSLGASASLFLAAQPVAPLCCMQAYCGDCMFCKHPKSNLCTSGACEGSPPGLGLCHGSLVWVWGRRQGSRAEPGRAGCCSGQVHHAPSPHHMPSD